MNGIVQNIHLQMKHIQEKQQKASSTIILFNQTNLLHKSSRKHPQCPERLIPTLISLQKISHKSNGHIRVKEVKKEEQDETSITVEDIEKMLMHLHGQGYWEFVKEMWHQGIKKSEMYINQDTYFMKDTYTSAIQAARTTVIGSHLITTSNNIANGLALVRPPGHHSGMKTQPHGFSFFNNLAVAVNHSLQKEHVNKIAIVDWDVHHGQGTQNLFYQREDVLFISMHRYDKGKFFPHIPQSSSANTGKDKGAGFNVNICWDLPQKPKGETFKKEQTCGDEEYAYTFDTLVIPIIQQYNPDMIFVSCGFDSAQGDTIGGLLLTATGYTYMTKRLMELNKKIMMVLEGGYNPDVLVWGTDAIIKALTNSVDQQIEKKVKKWAKKEYNANEIGTNGVQTARKQLQKYWKNI